MGGWIPPLGDPTTRGRCTYKVLFCARLLLRSMHGDHIKALDNPFSMAEDMFKCFLCEELFSLAEVCAYGLI